MTFIDLPGWAIALEVLWVIAISGYILLERRPPLATLAWIVGLAYLPWTAWSAVGPILNAQHGTEMIGRLGLT